MTTTHVRSTPAAVIDLRGVPADLYGRRTVIVITTVACVLVAFAVASLMSPRYVSQIKILIDPQGLQILPSSLSPAGASSEAVTAVLESQVQVFTSTEVLGKVIADLHLTDDPEFASAAQPAGPDGGAKPSSMDGRAWTTLRNLRRHIDVRRPDRTLVIELGVWTAAPRKSMRIADAIAKAYLAVQAETQAEIAGRTADALDGRLAALRAGVSAADSKVQAFRDGHDLTLTDGRLLSDRTLEDLSRQLSDQRGRTAALAARLAALGGATTVEALDTLPEALQSPAVLALKAQYAAAAKAEVDSGATLGPRHPTVLAERAQVKEIGRLIAGELARVRAGLATESKRATLVEEDLRRRVAAARDASAIDRGQLQALRDLESEAAARRALYDTVQRRAKEVREEGAIDKTDARVISPATLSPPEYVVPRLLVVAAGLLGGVLAGFVLAALLNVTGPRGERS